MSLLLPLPSGKTDEGSSPVYRVRAAGPALMIGTVRPLNPAACSDEPLKVRFPVMRKSSVGILTPYCVRHVAELQLPLAGRYFVEAILLYRDWNRTRAKQACTSWRYGEVPLFTLTLSNAA